MKLPETIIITGANGQTAVHLAENLLGQGCYLLLIAHDRTDRIEPLLKKYPTLCSFKQCDLTDFEQTKSVVAEIKTAGQKKPDALIHTAAIRSYDAKALSDSDPDIWNSIILRNITMTYNVLKCTLPLMIEQQKGKIVLFGSNVTRTGLPYGSAYAASKAAMANLVRTVAWETASDNIQINLVSPAPIDTKLEEDYRGEYLNFRKEYFEAYKKSHPAHKLVSLKDITEIVISLLNFDMNSVSGEEIYITGGVL